MAKLYGLTEEQVQEFRQMRDFIRNLYGPGIMQTPWGAAFKPQRHAKDPAPARGPRFVTFKISSVVTSQVGRYNAKTFTGGIDAAATGNLAEDNLGTLATEDDAVVWHPAETVGVGALIGGNIYRGQIVGTNTDGKKIILVSDETGTVLVKVTGNATGGGKYTGVIMNLFGSGSAVPESGNLAESDIGTAGSTTVLILNPPELSQSTHDLTSGTPKSKYFPAVKSPRQSDAGKSVFIIAGFDWEACT